MGLFSAKRAPPPVFPTDEVIPLRFADELYPVSFDFTSIFFDVLDTETLRLAADKVLRRDGWRELGARLRRKKDGKLEYHLPAEFSDERPLFLFSSAHHDQSINDHPVLKNLPKGNLGRPTIFKETSASFRPHTRGPNSPQAFDDWLYNDIPQLGIHIITFQDATVVTVTLLHTLTDFLGLIAFYHAWLATLHGKEDEIAPYIGYKDQDPLENLQHGKEPPRYVNADRLLSKWGFFKLILRNMWEHFWYPKASLRFFTLPGKFVQELSASARAEVVAAHKGEDPSKLFVSDSDVLCAWWTRLMVKCLGGPANRTVCVTNRFDSRDLLAKMGLLPSTNTSFIGNAAYSAHSFSQGKDYYMRGTGTGSLPLGLLAHRIRDSIKVHREMDQLRAQDAEFRESKKKTGHLPVYGDSGMLMHFFTNCYKGRLFQMDFSPALVSRGGEEKKKDAGLPVFISCTGMETRWSSRNGSAILGRTQGGDWWLSSRLRDEAWEKMEREFEKL